MRRLRDELDRQLKERDQRIVTASLLSEPQPLLNARSVALIQRRLLRFADDHVQALKEEVARLKAERDRLLLNSQTYYQPPPIPSSIF